MFIYGYHTVLAQITTAPSTLECVYVKERREDNREEILINACRKRRIQFKKSTPNALDKMSEGGVHQGFCAQINKPSLLNQEALLARLTLDTPGVLILVLDALQDPHNLGACLRSADAFGVRHVVLKKTQSAPLSSITYKCAAGAIARLNIYGVSNIAQTLNSLKKKGVWCVGLDSNTTADLVTLKASVPMALVMGSEAGLKRLSRENCDELFRIPMATPEHSLNVSVACGVALYTTTTVLRHS